MSDIERLLSAHVSDGDPTNPECHGCRANCLYCEGTHPWPCEVVQTVAHMAELERAAAEKAWDEGATKASPYGGGYLRSLLIENPYRTTRSDDAGSER